MKKIYITLIVFWFAILLWYFYYTNAPVEDPGNENKYSSGEKTNNSTSAILESTYNISKEYLALRYQTENILVNAKDYQDYNSWNIELTKIISQWQQLDENASKLESEWNKFSQESASINFWNKAAAYDSQEISNVFDKAPAGKKIATLAKHLWVDAKLAYKILQNTQDQIQADVWNEEGDAFKTLETTATVIKDGCKVIWFVWSIAVTGWTAALATASTLTKTAIIVWWADLTLEVTDDAAKIALWDKNKISKIVSTVRVVTEPVAGFLSIYSLPENMKTKFEKFSAVMVWLENFRTSAQEWKVLWIQLPTYQKPQEQKTVKVSVLTEEELDKWIEDIWLNKEDSSSKEEIEKILWIEEKIDENEANNKEESTPNNTNEVEKNIDDIPQDQTENISSQWILWTWTGKIIWTSSANSAQENKDITITFKEWWVIDSDNEWFASWTWKQSWNSIKIYEASSSEWFHEFSLNQDKLVFIKTAWPDSEWNYSEILAWSDFFGWIYLTMELTKK